MLKMAKQIKVSKQFLADFETVTKFYGFPDEDIEFLKNKACAGLINLECRRRHKC